MRTVCTVYITAGLAVAWLTLGSSAHAQGTTSSQSRQTKTATSQPNDDTVPPPVARRPELGLGLGVAGGSMSGFLGHVDVTAPGLSLIRGFDGRLEYDDWRSGVLWGSGDRKQGRAFTFTQVAARSPFYYGGGLGFLSTDRAGATTKDYCVQLLVGVNATRFLGLEATWIGSPGPSAVMLAGRLRI